MTDIDICRGMIDGVGSVGVDGNFTAGYSLYEGTIDSLETLVWERGGGSFTNVMREVIKVGVNQGKTPVPSSSPTNALPTGSMNTSSSIRPSFNTIDPVGAMFVKIIGVATILGMVIGVVVISILCFVVFKMFTQRQKGKAIPCQIRHEH